MIKYRPLSWFMKVWVPLVIAILIVSIIVNRKAIRMLLTNGIDFIKKNKIVSFVLLLVILLQVFTAAEGLHILTLFPARVR